MGWLVLAVFGASTVTAAPVISEFMADNESGLRDVDGDFSDWIEIFNPEPDPVELGGYFLTDDAGDPTEWRFPDGTILEPFGFIVVMASNKNRAVAGEELHTNFRLDAAGEYLALVAPDGVTAVSEFAPSFPAQFDNSSYGLEQTAVTVEEDLFDAEAPCRAHVPDNGGLGASWRQAGFDGSAWTAGTLGVGYERGTGFEDLIGLDVEQVMFNQNGSVYIRVPFEVTNPAAILDLDLEIQFDDGFSAFLNGTSVAVSNTATYPAWDANASLENPDASAREFRRFSLKSKIGLLQDPDLVLAIQGVNIDPSDEDLLIRPRLVASRITGVEMGAEAYFVNPSPGTFNGVQGELPSSEVIFSEPGQTFMSSLQLELRSQFEGENIRYTLDGSVPTAASPAYTGPLNITNSTQVRARVFGANNAVGPLAMESYIRLSSDLRTFSSNLPVVILENWGRGKPGTEVNVPGFWAIIEPDDSTDGRAEITDPFHIGTRCGMRRRGSSSAGWPKYALAVEAQDELGEDKGIEPLGMPKESDWILSGRYQFDRALMRNPLMYRLSNETGEYAVRTRFVEVFNNTGGGPLSYAGDYFGVYTLMEKIKRDDERVPVAKIGPRDTRGTKVTGGYMFKKDRLDPGDSGFSVNRMGTFGWVEPKEDEVHPSQQSWLQGYLNELDAALYARDWTNPATGKHFTEYLDTDSWLRHHWLNTLAMNVDGFRLSGYYYKHRIDTNDGKLGAGPIWDFDRTMESTDGRDNNPRQWDGTGDSSKMWGDSRFPWWGQVLTNPDFRQAHIDLWQELRKTTFSTENIDAIIDEFAAELDFQDPRGVNGRLARSPAARNFAKWTAVPPRNGSHAGEVAILKNWLRDRVEWIDSQYTRPPSFAVAPGPVAPGTTLDFTGGGGTIYYTTDNTDPRLSGGRTSSSATTTLPATIDSTTIITARARKGRDGLTIWSSPIRGTFLVGPLADASNLVITEIHYAPLPAGTPEEVAVATDAADFEFMELMNISATDTIELTDVRFEQGIEFTFTGSAITSLAPGERVLIVGNRNAFEARYGTAMSQRIAGEFGPSRLDNAGERIHLVDALGLTIADFKYNDKIPWPAEAGFAGYSMVLNSFAIGGHDYGSAGNWRSSGLVGGSPNSSDATALAGAPEDDDDRDGLTKLLEHAQGTSDSDPADGDGKVSLEVQSLEVDGLTRDYMTVTYQRNLSADDTVLLPEGSRDLRTWFGGEVNFPLVSHTNRGDGTALVTRRTAAPYRAGSDPALYVRLRAREIVAISFADWMEERGATDPQASFENSSLSHLLAYAVGADLASTPEAALPRISIVNEGGVDYPALTYRARKGGDALVCEVERSADLETWEGAGTFAVEVGIPRDHGDGTDTITVRSLQPIAPGSLQYLRLRVHLPR